MIPSRLPLFGNAACASSLIALAGAFSLSACTDNDHLPPTPAASTMEGGGVAGTPLTTQLNIAVIDSNTSAPLAGAEVFLGAGQAAHSVGTTDANGQLAISGLDGSGQVVSAKFASYASATWGLVKANRVTIPLEPQATAGGTVKVKLSVAGFADLPAPAAGEHRVTRFSFARPRGLEALEASLEGANSECTPSAGSTECTVTLDVPSDSTALLAVVAEGTDAGTPDDPTDDVLHMTHLGLRMAVDLTDGNAHDVSVALFDPSAVASASLQTSTGGKVSEVIGVPGISLNTQGQILLYPSLGAHVSSFLVPVASPALSNAKLWGVASSGDDDSAGWSRVYERGVELPLAASEMVALSTTSLLDVPTLTRGPSGSFALGAGGSLERIELATQAGEALNVLLFPSQDSFDLPSGILSAAPSSAALEAFDLEFDPTNFAFVDLARQSTRIAYGRNDSP